MGWFLIIWTYSIVYSLENYVLPFLSAVVPALMAVLLVVGIICSVDANDR